MRIVVDLQAAQSVSRRHGIGRYSLAFTKALARHAGPHEIWLALNSCFPNTVEELREVFKDLIPSDHIKIFYTNQPTAEYLNQTSNIKLSKKIREHFLHSLSPDVVHVSSLFEGWVDGAVTSIGEINTHPLTSVTLYDLIPFIHEKEYLQDFTFSKFYLKKIQNLKRADILFAISASSRQEAIDRLSIHPDHIINCSAGISDKFCVRNVSAKDQLELKQLYGINRQFILYVGGFDCRKNMEKLIEAFSLLPNNLRKLHQLVLVGKVIEATTQYINLLKNRYKLKDEELILTRYIPDHHLINLYNLCNLFILPSLHEGFGLPLLEALACGAVAITSNTTSLPELINCKDALFDPSKTESIIQKMVTALTNDSFREELRIIGKEQAKKFTWDACAKKALLAYEEFTKNTKKNFYSSYYPKKKIAFVSPMPPEKTGIAYYSLQLLSELEIFFDIVVIVDKVVTEDNWLIANFSIKGKDWLKKNHLQFDTILYQFGNSPFHYYMFKLFEICPGIVVLHDFYLSGVLHWADAILLDEKNTFNKILYESHGYNSLIYHKKNGREEALQKYPCNFHILKNAYGIMVHSQHAIDLANKWYNYNHANYIQKIPQLRLKTHSISRSSARKILNLNDNDFLICSFGFVTPNKLSHRICLSLINSNLSHKQNFNLVFVGENHIGDYGNEMINFVKKTNLKKTTITNYVPLELFETYLSAADLAIQLRTESRGETSSCIYSCLDFAIPTIINSYASFNELPDNVAYKLPENFSDFELVTAIEFLYENPPFRQQLTQNALEYTKQHHPHHIGKIYHKVINYFINHNPNYAKKLLIDNFAKNNYFELDSKAIISTITSLAANQIRLGPKQLLVDISILINSDEKTGIQRVVRAILNELLHSPPSDFRVEPIYQKNSQFYYARSYTTKILDLESNILEDNLLETYSGDIFLGLDFCPMTIPQSKTLLKSWRIKGVKLYFILYDLLPILRSEYFTNTTKPTFQHWLETISEFSHGIICISKYVAKEFAAWYIKANFVNQPKITFFHLGSDIDASLPSKEDFKNNHLSEITSFSKLNFLMVGRIEPRKGHLQVINAFEILWSQGFKLNLIIVGRIGWMVEKLVQKILNHSEYGKKLIWLQDASDEILKNLYSKSTALILASEDEGFGLPMIEAAKYGLSIIARDIPIFREIAGEHAFYFNCSTPFNLANSIKKWLDLQSNKLEPKSQYISHLTWKESAQRLLSILLDYTHFKKQEINSEKIVLKEF